MMNSSDSASHQSETLSSVSTTPLAPVLAEWERCSGGAGVADFRLFEADRIGAPLKYVALVEWRPEADKALYLRLVGSAVESDFAGLGKGAYLEDVQPTWYRDDLVAAFTSVFASGRADFQTVRVRYGGQRFRYHRLLLPFARHGDRVDLVLTAIQGKMPLNIAMHRCHLGICTCPYRHHSPSDPGHHARVLRMQVLHS